MEAKKGSLESVFEGASVFILGKVVYNLLTIVLNIIISRYLGAALYGIYALAYTIMQACTVFTNLGSDKSILRYIPDTRDNQQMRNSVFTLSIITSSVGGIVVMLLLILSSSTVTNAMSESDSFESVIQIFAIIIVFITLSRVIGSLFRAIEEPEYDIMIEKVLHPTTSVVFVAVAVYAGYSLLGAIYGLLLSSVVTLAGAIFLVYSFTDVRPEIDFREYDVIEFYNYSLPLMFKDAGSFLYTRIDVLMVGYFLSSNIVGFYNSAILIAGVLLLPLGAVNQIFPAVSARLHSSDEREELQVVYATGTRWVITMSLPTAAFLLVFGPNILSIFGDEFTSAFMILHIFVLGQLINTLVGPSGYLLMMTDHQYLVTLNQWAMGVLNIVLNYVLIIEVGILGGAIATASVLTLLNVIRVLEVWYLESMSPYTAELLKPAVATAVSGVSMIGVQWISSGVFALLVGGVLSVVLYLGTLIALGVEQRDIDIMKSLFADSVAD